MRLYVGNLVYNMTETELNDLFSPYGNVKSARIITDHYTRQSKNFGYVEMERRKDAYEAIEKLNGETVSDKAIVVKKAPSGWA